MVSPTVRRYWPRATVAGTLTALADEPRQNEAIDATTYVVDMELWDQITLTTNQAVTLDHIDQEASTAVAQFSGVVNHIAGATDPHRVIVTCTGPLARLRRTASADTDLSGMTDGAAVQSLLTACGIAFTAGNIQDAGYVLGANLPIIWRKDQPAHEIVRELDRVFGMTTIEVGAGTVARFAYDRAPTMTGVSRTFTSGSDALFWRTERGVGNLDAIQNVWDVRGASWTDAENCRLQAWARAEASHPKLGAGVYVRTQTFQSDIIQDRGLAEAVARRQMRWYNREPDEVRIEAANDPNIGPGDRVAVVEPVYGIGISTATPYTVLTVDRTGDTMLLTCVGGAAGAEGTVTSGVERICNDTTFPTFPAFPPFSMPPFGLPPSIPVISLGAFPSLGVPPAPGMAPVAPSPGGVGAICTGTSQCQAGLECVNGVCTDPDAEPDCVTSADCAPGDSCVDGTCQATATTTVSLGWQEDVTATATLNQISGEVAGPVGASGVNDTIDINNTADWTMTIGFRLTSDANGSGYAIRVGLGAYGNNPSYMVELYSAPYYLFPDAGDDGVTLSGGGSAYTTDTPPLDVTTQGSLVWSYDNSANSHTVTVTQGVTTWNLAVSGGTASPNPLHPTVWFDGGGGAGEAGEITSWAIDIN